MSSFTSPLTVAKIGGKYWQLKRKFCFHVGSRYSRNIIRVPAGFVTDFASSPQIDNPLVFMLGLLLLLVGHLLSVGWLFWLGLAWVLILHTLAMIPPWGKYGKPAVVHDFIYQTHCRTRREADNIFREGMVVMKENWWRIFLMYWGVRLGGFMAWHPRLREVSKRLTWS